jgi:hypothetical protein
MLKKKLVMSFVAATVKKKMLVSGDLGNAKTTSQDVQTYFFQRPCRI